MEQWKKRLKEAREAKGINKTAFAKEIGVSNATVTDWEKSVESGGIREIAGPNLVKVCATLEISPDWLLHGGAKPDWHDGRFSPEVKLGPQIQGKVPLISWVKAGEMCESPDNFQPGDAEEWLDCPIPHSTNSYCLQVVGDSMDAEGGYRDGEIIFVDPEVSATPGRDVVVRTPDGKMTFKRLKQDDDGLYLLALNGKKIIRVPEDTHICGVVIFSGFKR